MNTLANMLAGHRLGKFQVFQGVNLHWYFHLKAPNGEVVCASQGYTTREAALHGIAAVKAYAPNAPTEG